VTDAAKCPSNPKGSHHCFCASAETQHAMMYHQDVRCCWCGANKCVQLERVTDPEHGPYQVSRVRKVAE